MNDKISVIVPAYNAAQYLPKCLDSILAQTYTNLELIVVNDGSTDNTAKLLDAYAARFSSMKVIHKSNGGVSSARMRGIREASGEWLTFVDSDDWVEPYGLEILMHNAKMYCADISHYGSQRNLPDGRVYYCYNTGRVVLQEGLQGCKDLLDGSFIEPGIWNKLYRKELFDGLEEWLDSSIKINEDLLVNYFLFNKAKRAIFEDVCPYHYVVHSGSATTAPLNEHLVWDSLRVLRIILENCPKDVYPIVYRRMIRHLVYGASLQCENNRELLIPYRAEARRDLRERIGRVLLGHECDIKLKTMALLTAVWPACFGCIHRYYEKKSGIRKKYEM